MRKTAALLLVALLILPLSSGFVRAGYVPYVYTPTIPATALAAIALYKAHDYTYVLEADTWLMRLKTPDGAWAYQYGMAPQAKYTALALMALMRGESIARGLFNRTIHAGVYWLLYKQREDGSFGDYTDTALAVVALKEYEDFKYSWIPVKKAIENGIYYLQTHQPKTTMGMIFGYMALGDLKGLESVDATGVNALYKAFAIAYLTGKNVQISSNLDDPASLALLLYATGDKKYEEELVKSVHFGFWGNLKYQPPDLLEAAQLPGFSDLKPIACPYMLKVKPKFEWEAVVLAKYYVECNQTVDLSNLNFTKLRPWMVAEIARINHILGKPYGREVSYLLKNESNNHWGNFFNTAYVVWVLSSLNVSLNYTSIMNWLASNLTTKYPNYYYAYALMDFHRFNYTKAFNETFEIIKKRQNPDGAWGYTAGSPDNIKSTAEILKALLNSGLENTTTYNRGYTFLRKFLYANIPEPKTGGGTVELTKARFFVIKDGRLVENTTNSANVGNADGYVMVYPYDHPLVVKAVPVGGFVAVVPWKRPLTETGRSGGISDFYLGYIAVTLIVVSVIGLAVVSRRERKGKKSRKSRKK
ncbi:prenyltransferase/squalene oxidase repeat-containing protein [Thermococcus sp.]|uniref:prenyltransferase/squalene oxidase repeat-containing protein n=1 Tax=Thermococcus sp. TaxID=35749 RepID=UPI00263979BB|nr:prenyltransferase/squalene oxidase repeat-containing protein [Thermococcus sp.]